MTNLIAAITSSFLITNTEVKWPVVWENLPPPGGYGDIILAIAHGRYVPVTSGEWRTNVVTVRRIEITFVPELGIQRTNKNEWVSETHAPERREITWKPSTPVVLERSSDFGDWQFSYTNRFLTVSNSTAMVSGIIVESTNSWRGVFESRSTNSNESKPSP